MKKNILKALEEKTKPIEVRDELLNSKAEDMVRRRKLVLLSVLGLINFNVISLLQSGVIKKLPDIPIRVFDTQYNYFKIFLYRGCA